MFSHKREAEEELNQEAILVRLYNQVHQTQRKNAMELSTF